MHELAATENLLHTALKAAEENGAKKILTIRVGIGRYSGILPEYVKKYYEIASAGTIACDAELVFHYLPVRVCCPDCGHENVIDMPEKESGLPGDYRCPSCGCETFRLQPDNWDLYMENIEVEEVNI